MKIYYIPSYKKQNRDIAVINAYKQYCNDMNLPFGSDVSVERTENGKPYFIGSDTCFSISHTDKLTVICFAPFNIGIDCEKLSRTVKHKRLIADKVFSQNEREYAQDSIKFLEIWVKKEAYVKFTGKGLADIKDFDTFSLKGKYNLSYYNEHIICTYYE